VPVPAWVKKEGDAIDLCHDAVSLTNNQSLNQSSASVFLSLGIHSGEQSSPLPPHPPSSAIDFICDDNENDDGDSF